MVARVLINSVRWDSLFIGAVPFFHVYDLGLIAFVKYGNSCFCVLYEVKVLSSDSRFWDFVLRVIEYSSFDKCSKVHFRV